jgi:hypothetical protein
MDDVSLVVRFKPVPTFTLFPGTTPHRSVRTQGRILRKYLDIRRIMESFFWHAVYTASQFIRMRISDVKFSASASKVEALAKGQPVRYPDEDDGQG